MEFKEEWSSIVTITEPDPSAGARAFHTHEDEYAAHRFKDWRVSRPANDSGYRWAPVTVQLRRRLVTEWEEVD